MPNTKKLDGKTCVYCSDNPAKSWDHVIARGFFADIEKHKAHSPQVPACHECNNLKSRVENSLLVLMQFGGGSVASQAMLKERMENLLAGNKKMHRRLADDFVEIEAGSARFVNGGSAAFLIDHDLVLNLSQWNKYIAKAAYYLWRNIVVESEWKIVVINPPNHQAYMQLKNMISASSQTQRHSIEHIDGGWSIEIAESGDGLILENFEFNSISQFVLIFKDTQSQLIDMWEKFGY